MNSPHGNRGFSLIEIVVAIGIFAFVAVAILSLFSVALKSRAESSLETKSAIVAQEVFSAIRMSGGLRETVFRDGPALQPRNNQKVDLTKDTVAIGYPTDTTVPFGLWHSARGQDPKSVWDEGRLEAWAVANQITLLAYVRAEPTEMPNLWRVTCEVRSPASLPLANSEAISYTTLFSP
jgi:prepilin-type N-terminal cleavage/methylation domain-containing protein